MTNVAMDPETSMPSEMTFSILNSAAPVLVPRVGKLAIPGRQTISTPHFAPLTTRGAVSHIAHDVVKKETAINSLYIGLEDCMYLDPSTTQDMDHTTNQHPDYQSSKRSIRPRYIKPPLHLENLP
jgi:hypothetical protein